MIQKLTPGDIRHYPAYFSLKSDSRGERYWKVISESTAIQIVLNSGNRKGKGNNIGIYQVRSPHLFANNNFFAEFKASTRPQFAVAFEICLKKIQLIHF